MKFIKNIITFAFVIVLLLLINRWYLGGFSNVEIVEKKIGPYTIAYTEFTGKYNKIGPVMEKIYQELSGQGITQLAGIGIYYNDPTTITSGQELRSDIGSIVDQKDLGKLQRNSSVYKIKTIPQTIRVVAEFPYKNSFSYIVGPIKMYPLINKYMKARAYKGDVPRIEIYDMDMKKIYFIVDVIK